MCDVIAPQIFAGKELPILAVIDRKHTTEKTDSHFEPATLVYKPIEIAETHHITVTVHSDNLEYNDFQETPTVVNLHFKRNDR